MTSIFGKRELIQALRDAIQLHITWNYVTNLYLHGTGVTCSFGGSYALLPLTIDYGIISLVSMFHHCRFDTLRLLQGPIPWFGILRGLHRFSLGRSTHEN